MTGYIKCYRDVFDHNLFHGEDFSRRDAWLWLIANAAWKSHRARYRNKMVGIERGQLPGGRQHLAATWGWSEKRVRNFLQSLADEGMIRIDSKKGQHWAIITVCNYDKFQDVGPSMGQERANEGPRKGHTEEGKEIKEDTTLCARDAKQMDLHQLAEQLQKAAGAAINLTNPVMHQVDEPLFWIEQGASLERHILPVIKEKCAGKMPNSISTWRYFTNAVIQRMHDRNSTTRAFRKPVPAVSQVESQDSTMAYFERFPTPANVLPVE
jgi:hypothetical protein